jgi:hypothetical protein
MSISQNQLNNFTSVEVATNEFCIVRVFLECLNKDHVGFHERVAYCSYSVENLLGGGRRWSRYGPYEVDEGIRSLTALVDSLKPERHDSARIRYAGRERLRFAARKCEETMGIATQNCRGG